MIAYPITAGTILTRVLEAGTLGAPSSLLVHGLSSRADRWVRNLDALASAGFHVFAADLPGHGFAAKNVTDDHSIGGYAQFVLDLMDTLRLQRTTIVGTSLGGQVVAAAALRAPERIERMMMIGSTGFIHSPPERAKGFRDWIMNLTPESHRPKLERVFTDKSLATDAMVLEDIRINTSPGAAACFDKFLTYMAYDINRDLVGERLPVIADIVPLLLFWGVDDTSVSVEVGRAARAKLPKARLVTVEHLNHTPYYENPPLFNEVLLRFIDGTLDTMAAPGLTLN
jgi:2-hydroxy-6-oxonona-2,4-dienedioate hydrolase